MDMDVDLQSALARSDSVEAIYVLPFNEGELTALTLESSWFASIIVRCPSGDCSRTLPQLNSILRSSVAVLDGCSTDYAARISFERKGLNIGTAYFSRDGECARFAGRDFRITKPGVIPLLRGEAPALW